MITLVPTPIGNLKDMTERALDALRSADVIACEDTRHTLPLLTHFGIAKPLTAFHQHNWKTKGPELIARALSGESVAVVTDAGMPGISDPGAELVTLAIAEGVAVSVLPGPSAALTALVLSGLPCERFAFEGFLPRDNKQLKARLAALKDEQRTIIFYEAPHRLAETLAALLDALGPRPAAAVRELTKLHEEAVRAPLNELLRHFEEVRPRGEFVLVVGGCEETAREVSDDAIRVEMQRLLQGGARRKEAARHVSEQLNVSVNRAYELSIEKYDK